MEHSLGRTFEWRGRTVAWDAIGDGPPLVMLHGTPWSSWLWRPIAERLAEHFRVHLYDLPGYGASSKHPEHPVGLDVQGELLAELLPRWGLERPHVIAHDIGGAVALRARLLHGARFASLALVDVVALRPWGSPFFTLVQQHAAVFEQLPTAIHRGAVEAYIRGASHRGLQDAALAALIAPWLSDEGQSAFYRQIAHADERHTTEFEGQLGDLEEPVHIVWGERDAWIPPDRADRLQDAIPHASMTTVPEAGHLIQLDAPEALEAELLRWAASVV